MLGNVWNLCWKCPSKKSHGFRPKKNTQTLQSERWIGYGGFHGPTHSSLDGLLPCGRRLHNYGKSQFLMGKSTTTGHFQ